MGIIRAKLAHYSNWLHDYDINHFRDSDLRLELPGQYDGNHEPIPDLNVKISYFLPEIMIIQSSLRKPKRLSIFGSDEKIYHLLLKGGEDLRLDERIQQLFGLMNEVFFEDGDCLKRQLSIKTYSVVPVTKNMGLLEWVTNTKPLKDLFEKEMNK